MDRRNFLKFSGWSLLGLAASGSLLKLDAHTSKKEARKVLPSPSNFKMYWGDLHNHCNITYGHGDMRDAFEAAKEQLDFVSVTPHAMWPDIPGANDPRLKWVIDYHTDAFKRLRNGNYDKYRNMTKEYNKEGEFLTFIGYEAHSMKNGDHVALHHDLNADLIQCTSIDDWKEKFKGQKVYITPHHMGYQTGYRGYDWQYFTPEQTPFVEMFSRHGLAECDMGDYPYLHDMGPRQWEGTVQYGLEQGHKFGFIGSTDQHSGYPGSYGDGRVGVLANSLTRDEIWNGLGARHTCCVTGDKINIDFRINDAFMGDVVKASGKRRIYVNVEGESCIDYVDIIKNGKLIARMNGPHIPVMPTGGMVRCKIKMEYGWNREEQYVTWKGNIRIDKGQILSVTPCFRGAAFTSPQEGETEFHTHVNRIKAVHDRSTELEMYTSKNPNTTTPATQAVILEVEMPLDGVITSDFNGKQFSHTLAELLEGSRTHFVIGWLSEAVLFNRAMPESCYCIEHYMEDKEAERDTDYYYVRVRQKDQQWAWSSPIWVERK